MARVYVKRMLPADKEQKRSHVLLEGVTTESSSTDNVTNGIAMEADSLNVEADTLRKILNLEGVTISETSTDEPSYVYKRTSVVNECHLGNGDQRDINDNDEEEQIDVQGIEQEDVAPNAKTKGSSSVGQYSNWLQDLALPILFRRRRDSGRSGNDQQQPNHKLRPRSDYVTTATHLNQRDKRDDNQLDLASFEYVENIELHHLDGFIFSSQKEKGRGHSFECLQLSSPTWCDKCGDFIWGVYKQCLRCKHCQYTCHHKCRQLVSLDCASLPDDEKKKLSETTLTGSKPKLNIVSDSTVWFRNGIGLYETFGSLNRAIDLQAFEALAEVSAAIADDRPIVTDDLEHLDEPDACRTLSDVAYSPSWKYFVEDDADSGYHTGESTLQATPAPAPHVPSERTLTREDLRRRIDAFNNNQHGLLMTLNEEVLTFQGFIRVHMNLMRPISMVLPMRPPSIYDVISSDGEGSDDGGEGVDQDTLTTSFYLPKDTSKVIHITSSTTTSEVIRALLQKFKITDNPRKFALYEKIIDGDKPSMRRMVDDERPLPLCLSWSCEGLDSRKFVLQENDTGEIIWDEFSIPELENFLRILDREEEEYVEQVKARYTLLRIQMQKEMNAIAEEEKEKELFDKPEDKPPDPSSDDGSSSDKNLQPDNREPVFV